MALPSSFASHPENSLSPLSSFIGETDSALVRRHSKSTQTSDESSRVSSSSKSTSTAHSSTSHPKDTRSSSTGSSTFHAKSSTSSQFDTKSRIGTPSSQIGTSSQTTLSSRIGISIDTGSAIDPQSTTPPIISAHASTSIKLSLTSLSPNNTLAPPSQISAASFINSVSSSTSPTTLQDPTQSSETTGRPLGPIIGGAVGGAIFVALSVLTAVIIIKRRRRKQDMPIPTANPLLDDPRIRELADQRGLSTKKSTNHNLAASSVSDIQSQDASERSSQEPILPSARSELESAMQRQMEMIHLISQRMITALEAHQRGNEDTDNEPPDYESHASTNLTTRAISFNKLSELSFIRLATLGTPKQ